VALAVLTLCGCVYVIERGTDYVFRPFQVTIRPVWHEIFLDFGILNAEQMDALRQQIRQRPSTSRYDPFRDDLSFTILRQDLIYSNDHGSFHSSVDFAREIKEISGELSQGWCTTYCARFRLREGGTGYKR